MCSSRRRPDREIKNASQDDHSADWVAVLTFLPIITSESFSTGRFNQQGHFVWSEELTAFHQVLSQSGIIKPYNWVDWQKDGLEYVESSQKLSVANLNTLAKLLTMHLRIERFNEGHLVAMVDRGHIASILERAAQLINE